jgi:hypothetical protein
MKSRKGKLTSMDAGRRWSRVSATISGVPRIRFSFYSVIGCVLASRLACFWYGHICVPAEPAFGNDDYRCCEEHDHAAEDQESCGVRRRDHIVGELDDCGI